MKANKVYEFSEDEAFVVIRQSGKSVDVNGIGFDIHKMFSSLMYVLLKNNIVSPTEILAYMNFNLDYIKSERKETLPPEETLPPGIKEMIDEVWPDLSELSGGSDDHCS